MTRELLRAKVHRIAVTECCVEYEGSLTLDKALMDACDMRNFEKVDVLDVDNGSRFTTYLIEGEAGSGVCCVNGAAARMVSRGDRVIIASYCTLTEEEIENHEPRIVLIGEGNRVKEPKNIERRGDTT